MRVSKSKTRTVGASNGKIKAKADAKMMATTQQLIAYDGSYVRGYTAGMKQHQLGNNETSQRAHTSESLARSYSDLFCPDNLPQSDGLQQEHTRKDDSNIQDDGHRERTHIDRTVGNGMRDATVSTECPHGEQDGADCKQPNASNRSEDPEGGLEHDELRTR